MFDEETHNKLVDLYSIPHVDEVILRKNRGKKWELPPMKCWECHHRPCICKK